MKDLSEYTKQCIVISEKLRNYPVSKKAISKILEIYKCYDERDPEDNKTTVELVGAIC